MNRTNCTALESLIALYVEGDLPVSNRRRVETHLQSCTACSALAEDLRESQSMFKSLRAATVNPSDLAGVRERVLNEVGDMEPAPGWAVTMHRLFFAGLRRRNAIAGVLVTALITGSVWYSEMRVVHEVSKESPVKVARFEPPAVLNLSALTPASAEPRPIVTRAVPIESPVDVQPETSVEPPIAEAFSQESPTLQIPMKFVTDDPDIIIYWLPTDKGD